MLFYSSGTFQACKVRPFFWLLSLDNKTLSVDTYSKLSPRIVLWPKGSIRMPGAINGFFLGHRGKWMSRSLPPLGLCQCCSWRRPQTSYVKYRLRTRWVSYISYILRHFSHVLSIRTNLSSCMSRASNSACGLEPKLELCITECILRLHFGCQRLQDSPLSIIYLAHYTYKYAS